MNRGWRGLPLGAVVLGVLAVFGPSTAQTADEVLSSARSLYASGNYDSTVSLLRAYVKENGTDPAMERMVPLLAESLVRLSNHKYFSRLMDIYRKKYAQSDFMPRMLYLEGVVAAREKHFVDALVSFSGSLKAGAGAPIESLAVEAASVVCRNSLGVDELDELAGDDDLDSRVAELVAFNLFMKLHRRGQDEKARGLAERFLETYPQSGYSRFAQDVVDGTRGGGKGEVRIGLLAPLSGYDADLGKQVVQGVQLAVERHNRHAFPKVQLIIGDTKSNMIEAARRSHEMIHVHKVPLVLGPVLSPNAAVTAGMLMDRKIVMITPTATDEGIAGLGKNIFQLNVTLGTLGSRIARYAVENLNITNFAVVAPLSDYGRILAAGFKESVKALGAEIVAEEYFDEGASDYRVQLESIRARLIARRRGNRDGSVDALNAAQRVADSVLYADSTLAVGGLFIPAESEDVVMLAPQVHFHRIRTQLLGSTGWHTSATILDGKRYVNDAIISTSFEVDPHSEPWRSFSSEYQTRYGKEPDRIAAPLGFDAASLALQALVSAGDDPDRIAEHLHTVRKHHGVSGLISFDPNVGANTETAIMKIKDRQFVRIE